MIKIFKDRADVSFGNGDICISSGITLDSEVSTGFLILCNQEPRDIGAPGVIKMNTCYCIEDFPVVIKFTKVESIDVLIKTLQEAKELMVEEE